MAEEEWLPDAYRRLDGILTQMRGVRGLSPGRVETVKELVKNNPEMYLNPQGLTQLLQGIQVNPFQIPLVVTHTFGGATPQFQPVVYPQQQNMPQFIPQLGYPQQQGFVPQPISQRGQDQEYGGFATGRGLSKEEVVGMVMEIIKARDKERELEEAKRLAQDKEKELEAIRKKLEVTEKSSSAHSSDKELEAIRKKIEALEKGGGAPSKEPKGGLSEERLVEILDERDMKSKENKDKNALIQTLDGVRQALDNLHGRVSAIEQGGVPGKHSEDDTWNKKILNAAGNKLINLLEKGEATEERLRAFAKELKPSLPPGSRSEYDMRVEQAQHEAEARKVEAQEHRKGFEAIASGIRDGLASVGWNIGAGAASGSPRSGPSPEAQTKVRMPASEPQPMVWRGGFWHTRCAYSDCRAPISFEDGKSTIACPACHRVIHVQPTEEELKRKFEAGKIEPITAEPPKAKTEVKLEKPKREEPEHEEPQREEPQQKEEKPSEGAGGAESPEEKEPEDEKQG